ncbi:MAG: preprotein translocase subunit SecG [Candidatus Omnitrophica bacterium]|nr:preprotein translocase subunit SecG [Candidatus Omnitrophota bacterium]
MFNLVLFIHIVVTISLIGVILIQRGRSSGLIEALGGVESIFGTKTSSFFVRLTVVLAVIFFLTSLSLAYLSKQHGASLLEKVGEEKIQEKQDVNPTEKISEDKINSSSPSSQEETNN